MLSSAFIVFKHGNDLVGIELPESFDEKDPEKRIEKLLSELSEDWEAIMSTLENDIQSQTALSEDIDKELPKTREKKIHVVKRGSSGWVIHPSISWDLYKSRYSG